MEISTSLAQKRDEIYRLLGAAFEGVLNLFKELAFEFDEEGDLAEKFTYIKDDDSRTALHVAALGGRTHILKYLVGKLKLDVNVKDIHGDTPLHCAAKLKYVPTSVYLIDNGANLNAMNDEGLTVLHCAAKEGVEKLVQMLISKGVEVDANREAGTPLQHAADSGMKDSVKVLLENNANPNIYSDHNVSPLVLAIFNGSLACVKLLLEAGADPNSTVMEYKVPLDLAVWKGNTEIIKCLLDAGADPNVLNNTTLKMLLDFTDSKLKGTVAVKRKDFRNAIKWYTKAIICDETDATMYSNRSLCWARLKEGNKALVDAKMCVQLLPLWPKAYYRLGVAYMILKEFEKAADAFYDGWKLDRKNLELERAFWDAIEAQNKRGRW